jgi:hypothetical protein
LAHQRAEVRWTDREQQKAADDLEYTVEPLEANPDLEGSVDQSW